MRWSCMDLLSLQSTLGLLHHQVSTGKRKLYDLVLDKSTSDSISCGPDHVLQLPYPLSINGWTRRLQNSGTTATGAVHPLHLLAVHLASLTTPRTARWICVSYSEDRFPFFSSYPPFRDDGVLSGKLVERGFPDPKTLWKLEKKYRVTVQVEDHGATDAVHRPETSDWVYVLVRTDVEVH